MSEPKPKFKIGDKVVWNSGPRRPGETTGEIVEVFEPGVSRTGGRGTCQGYSYIVYFPDSHFPNPVRFLGELALEEEECWEPCPGAHRPMITRVPYGQTPDLTPIPLNQVKWERRR